MRVFSTFLQIPSGLAPLWPTELPCTNIVSLLAFRIDFDMANGPTQPIRPGKP